MLDRNKLKSLSEEFVSHCQKKYGFDHSPNINFVDDENNARDPLGKTAFYDPANKSITVYITNRHPKDILRSLAHELTHHMQNLRGEFDNIGPLGEDYAQNNSHMRKMEEEAYASGLDVRDFEDSIKKQEVREVSSTIENKLRKFIKESISSILKENNMTNVAEEEGVAEEKERKKVPTRKVHGLDPEPIEKTREVKPIPPVKEEVEELKEEESEEECNLEEDSTIKTPEQERTLYESRFGIRNSRLFEKLVNSWIKK